jgi:hypothetical protein
MSGRTVLLVAVPVAAALNQIGDGSCVMRIVTSAVLLLAPGWGLSRWWPPCRESMVNFGFAFLTAALSADVLLACALGLTGIGLGETAVRLSFAVLGLLATATAPRVVRPVGDLRLPAVRAGVIVRAAVALSAFLTVGAAVVHASHELSAREAGVDLTALSVTPAGRAAHIQVTPSQSGTYRLVLTLDGAVLVQRTDVLRDGDDVSVTVAAPAEGSVLTAELYRNATTEALRRVTLVGNP